MNFYAKEVCYVGLLVSEEGVKMNPKDHEAVQTLNCKTSQTVRDIRQLLRFLSYYGTYVQDFSRIAKPLYDMLQLKQSTPTYQEEKSSTRTRMANSVWVLVTHIANQLNLQAWNC